MQSPEINELASALVKAQAEFSAVPKGSVNPFFKSTYAALPDVVATAGPVLAKHGLAVSQFVSDINDVGIDLRYIDPKDPNLALKRFREAELFTYAGTGAAVMSTRQTSQLLALMISGELLARQIHREAIAAGPGTTRHRW